jgi:hypothetical protein
MAWIQTFQNEDRLAGQVLKRKVKGGIGGKSLEKKSWNTIYTS